MKKLVIIMAITLITMSTIAGAQTRPNEEYWNHNTYDPDASKWAASLSCMYPGAGEWYNRDFQGSFPITECVTGYLCPLIGMCSFLDAAAGAQDEELRLDFWNPTSNGGYRSR